MRILNVEAYNAKTQDRQLFDFSTSVDGKALLVAKSAKLHKYIEYCFGNSVVCNEDVTVYLEIDGKTFILQKTHAQDDTVKTTLKQVVDNKKQIVAKDSHIVPYLERLIGASSADVLSSNVITGKAFETFEGNINYFSSVATLLDINNKIMSSNSQLKSKSQQVKENVHALADFRGRPVSRREIEDTASQLEETTAEINQLNTQLADYKAKEATNIITGSIMTELANAQSQYDDLAGQKQSIEEQREQLRLNDDIAAIIPKVAQLELLDRAGKEIDKSRAGLVKELEWQENELSAITLQLEEKQRQATTIVDKQSKIDVINQELTTIAELYTVNKNNNEQLIALSEQQQRLQAEKVLFKNKLQTIENRINDTKKSIDTFHVPNQSIGELLESTRIDVKIDEVAAQIDKLTNELSIKESQIAEKESNLVVQIKRFKSVAQLDVAVAPIKAKDTILQVLDAKYNKLETINVALKEKRRNLERAQEDYNYRILQLEHSKSALVKELDKVLLRKQEEFKREVYLGSQKIFSDDASGVFAVTCNLADAEVTTLKQDIIKRDIDRDVLIGNANMLTGKIDEITRQIDINSAEMATLRGEKANINNRYNEIVASNRNEAVFNYLKALDGGNGTRYLLDVQHEAVASEAELTELKRNADSLRTRLSGLQSRLRYLKETQDQLGSGNSLDSLVATNDKLKEQLSDIGDRLSTNYEQYRNISDQLENTEIKLSNVEASIVELGKTITVNEQQIELSTNKAKKYAGGDDLEQALANFRYEITDVESERQMLSDSKKSVEKEVFRKRLELEKLQYISNNKKEDHAKLLEDVQFELNLRGININSINSATFKADTETLRSRIAQYDSTRATLAERIDNYYSLLSADGDTAKTIDKSVVGQIAMLQGQLVSLTQLQAQLEQELKSKLTQYMATNNDKIRYAVAATEAQSLNQLSQSISHNDIVQLLVEDKIGDILRLATSYLRNFVGVKYTLSLQQEVLNIACDGITTAYGDLSKEHQFAIFVAILLAVPCADHSEGRWLIFDEKLPVDRQFMSSMVAGIQGISYLTTHKSIKAGQN